MSRILALVFLFCVSVLALPVTSVHADPGCKKGDTGKIVGGVLGGLAGGILGNKVDGGHKRGVGTALGAVAGVIAGSSLGRSLDKCQQEAVAASTQASLETNAYGPQSRRAIKNPSGSGDIGYTETVRRNDENGVECRIQRVVVVDPATGEDLVQPLKQCRTGANGGFQPVTGKA